MSEPLDKFGAFIVEILHDKMLYELEMLLRGGCKAPELQELQSRVCTFTDAQKHLIQELAERIIGMHDLLFAIQEQADAAGGVRLLVEGQEIAKLSDGLQGEIFGEDGWIVRFSKYPARTEVERSRWAKDQIQKMFGGKDEDVG